MSVANSRLPGPNPSLSVVMIVRSAAGILLPSDRAAVSLATTHAAGHAQVCCPVSDEVAYRYAMAAGAVGATSLDHANFDIYIIGREGAGPEGELAAARIAQSVNAALVLDVLDIEIQSNGVRVTRDLSHGAREVMDRAFPVVLMISDQAQSRIYVSRYRQLKVTMPTSDAGQTTDQAQVAWQPFRPRTRTTDLATKTAGTAAERMLGTFGLDANSMADGDSGHVISADSEGCAAHLIRYLVDRGFIESRFASRLPDHAADSSGAAESVRVRQSAATLSAALLRSPRPLEGSIPGISRRPRPFREDVAMLDRFASPKLVRLPRPLHQEHPTNIRGPFPVIPQE